jgi:hypothetical protein
MRKPTTSVGTLSQELSLLKQQDPSLPTAAAAAGLELAQEFVHSDPKRPPLFRCGLLKCDGAFGDARRFARHLVSQKHARSYEERYIQILTIITNK